MGQADFVIGDISMDGFQVVRGLYFSRMLEPSLKLWNTAISFHVPAYSALNNCESVQMLVNLEQRKILVKPVPSKEPDAINWIRDPAKPKTTKMECSLFTRQLFTKWGWDDTYQYRTNGKLVKFDKKLMLLFDFNRPELWQGMKLVREDG